MEIKRVYSWIIGATSLAVIVWQSCGDRDKSVIGLTLSFKQVDQLWGMDRRSTYITRSHIYIIVTLNTQQSWLKTQTAGSGMCKLTNQSRLGEEP